MINLLPSSTREDMLYARRNSVLFRWLIGLIVAFIGVAVIVVTGMIYLTESTKAYEERTEEGKQALLDQDIQGVQAQVEEISNNVKLTTDVLSREVLFSKLIKQIGAALPTNSALQGLQITGTTGGITLSVSATDTITATQVQVNLEDPSNKVFQKADIEEIQCLPESAVEVYKCTVQIKALFAENSPFLYIEQGAR